MLAMIMMLNLIKQIHFPNSFATHSHFNSNATKGRLAESLHQTVRDTIFSLLVSVCRVLIYVYSSHQGKVTPTLSSRLFERQGQARKTARSEGSSMPPLISAHLLGSSAKRLV